MQEQRMKLLGNFSSRPEACCRGARDLRGEHQERFRPGLPIIACPLARPTFVLQGIPDLSATGRKWKGKGKASPSFPLSQFRPRPSLGKVSRSLLQKRASQVAGRCRCEPPSPPPALIPIPVGSAAVSTPRSRGGTNPEASLVSPNRNGDVILDQVP